MNKDATQLLQRACRDHNLSLLQHLLRSGVPATHPDPRGRYPLHECLGSLPCVQALVEHGHVDVNACKRGDWSVLAVAANKGFAEVAEYLVARGADVNWRTKEGYLPIHLAAAEGHADVVRVLLETGCHGDGEERSRMCAEVTRSGMLPVHLAALKGSVETFELLQAAANHIESRENGGATPLFHACSSGNGGLVARQLDVYHAQFRLKDKLGREPVVYAAIAGHAHILRILMEHGADLSVKDDFQGFSLLHHACKEGHLEVVRYLLEQGASREVTDLKGRKPGEIAAIWKHEDVKSYLASL